MRTVQSAAIRENTESETGKSMDKKYSFEDLIHIVKVLRSENGCPWDRRQTHTSLKPCVMEEAAELVSSIRIYDKTGNAENMREELGDILLQVMLHSQIAEEEGIFTLGDVICEISRKMIRRHPHVFGEMTGEKKAEDIPADWEEIKRREKEGKEWIESPLREIPKELPALTRAAKVLKKADKLYGTGSGYKENAARLEESVKILKELNPEEDSEELAEIIGNILINLSDIAGLYKISQEQILTDRVEDMIDKYEPAGKP